MADERQPNAAEADSPGRADTDGTVRAKPLCERDTLPEIPSQRQPSWKPVPPQLVALSARKPGQ